jgi:hypothetical protein
MRRNDVKIRSGLKRTRSGKALRKCQVASSAKNEDEETRVKYASKVSYLNGNEEFSERDDESDVCQSNE